MTNRPTARCAGGLTTAFATVILGLGMGAAPMANAADDCGLGYHLVNGTCIVQPWLAQDRAVAEFDDAAAQAAAGRPPCLTPAGVPYYTPGDAPCY